MIFGIKTTNALTIGDCNVLVSFKLQSSLDEDTYICKGEKFGSVTDGIYYSGEEETIVLNEFNAYYFTNWDEYDVTLNLNGSNNISLLHVGESNIKIIGTGELKFKEDSYVKKISNGEPVYQFLYKDKTIISENKKIYEGTIDEFIAAYASLNGLNKLPEEYNENDYKLVQVIDYVSMTPVSVTESWIEKHINTELSASVVDGYGLIKYVKTTESTEKAEKAEEKNKTQSTKVTTSTTQKTTLKSDNVILISDKKLNKKYTLNVNSLDEQKDKYGDELEKYDVLSLYDVSVYNGKKEVSMKNGSYTIKIKLIETEKKYSSYKIIYVNDDGEIVEYIDGEVEDGYIVFKTSHLSQYGVIGEIKEEVKPAIVVTKTIEKKVNVSKILKMSFFMLLVFISFSIILFVRIKSKNVLNRGYKKKRA